MLLVSVFSLIIIVVVVTEAVTTTLEFDDCQYTHYLTTDDVFYIKWKGKHVNYFCKVEFSASLASYDDKKICIEANGWDINNNDVKLQYFSGSFFYTKKREYDKFSEPSTSEAWCTDSDDNVAVQLETQSYGDNQGQIELKVYIKEVDYSAIVGAIVGGVIGGIVLLSIIVTIVVVIACRRRRGNTGTVLSNASSSANIMVSQTTAQTQGQWNTGYSAPQSYAGQQYPTSQQYPSAPGQWEMGYSTPQHYNNAVSQPSTGGTTGGESLDPPPYSSITDNQQPQKQ